MKLNPLSNISPDSDCIPLKFLYNKDKDILMIVYKDLGLNKKFVYNIEKPKVPVFIVKPEYRNETGFNATFDCSYRHDWISRDIVDEHWVSYKYRENEISRILGIPKEEVLDSPYVGWGDLSIDTIYFMLFRIERGCSISDYTPSIAFADIEADIKGKKGIGNYGEVPITCIVYIDTGAMQVYQLVKYDENYGGMQDVVDHVNDIVKDYEDKYNQEYGNFQYHIGIFKKEIDMIACFWELVRRADNDFLEFWNAPYDVSNLVLRIESLGYNPEDIIHDEAFSSWHCIVREDKEPLVKRKKHIFDISVKPIICCQMRNYAGIRAARPVFSTYKLNKIADLEIGKKKIDYSEEGDLTTLLYGNLRKYMLYNLNDSLLQFGIDMHTHDTISLYSKMYKFCLTETNAFVSITMLTNYSALFGYNKRNAILANNRNKNPKNAEYLIQLGYGSDAITEDEAEEMDEAINEINGISEEEIEDIINHVKDNQAVVDEKGNKKKFTGAIVMSPKRQHSTGYLIAGVPSKHVHRFVIDGDMTSEYPNAIRAMNASNDTWIGKPIIDSESDFNLPMYPQYKLIEDEEKTYKCNIIAVFLETAAQGDYILAGSVGFKLPSFIEMKKLLMKEGII